ncbi:MAG: 5-oxoprolinase (ATP-hydrolyzing), partial [Pirellulaceae bacterium]
MKWQFWIDVGGTFTDCFAVSPAGLSQRLKVLSSAVTKGVIDNVDVTRLYDPSRAADRDGFWSGYSIRCFAADGSALHESEVLNFIADRGEFQLALPCPDAARRYELFSDEEAPILAIRSVLQLGLEDPIPNCVVRLGTTRGTNALLTRSGAKTALVTTRGFRDVLQIGNQDRPHIFQLNIQRSEMLYQQVVEADERINASGEIARPLVEEHLRNELTEVLNNGIESVAICLLNAYCNGSHERRIAEIAREVGFPYVRSSHEVAPLIKIVSRGDTTVADAYLNPVLQEYIASLQRSLGEASELRLLTSAGGLVSAAQFSGKDSILSGPAGGVVGFSRVAKSVGFPRAIGFDMGGTSTDVSRYDGRFQFEYETKKAGVRIVAPMMAIETVAAGGGSICDFDGVKLTVGPASAGAEPGPACYGRGGPLAVTDLNVALGKVPPDQLPFPLDYDAVHERLESLCRRVETATGKRLEALELAAGFLQVANANMAEAIRSISVAQGYDPREFAMVAFGAAAAQHACSVAEALDIDTIINHPDAGVLSALGIGLADVVRHDVRGVYRAYDDAVAAECSALSAELALPLVEDVVAEGISREAIEVIHSLDLRYHGTDAPLTVTQSQQRDFLAEFLEQHQRLYGYLHGEKTIEVVAVRVEVIGSSTTELRPSVSVQPRLATPLRTTRVTFAGQQMEVPVYDRAELQPGAALTGPAIVVELTSTTVIDPGWRAEVLSEGEFLLQRDRANAALERIGVTAGEE